MTEETKIDVWRPNPFEGTDLLPVDMVGQTTDTVGRDNVEASDLILPTIAVLQGQSDAVTAGDVEGAVPGKFFHSGAQEVFDGPIRVLLCAHTKSRALFPKENNPAYSNIERCVSKDGVEGTVYGDCDACEHRLWGENNSPPLCSDSHNFTAITPYGPAIIRFSRTSYKTARQFLTTWTLTPKPLWAHPAVIAVRKESKVVGGKPTTFFKMDMRWAQRETVPPAAMDAARAIHDQVSAAHEEGRFGSDDEKNLDDIKL